MNHHYRSIQNGTLDKLINEANILAKEEGYHILTVSSITYGEEGEHEHHYAILEKEVP